MQIVVLDGGTTDQGDADETWRPLSALGPTVVHARTPAAQVIERARGAAAVITNKVRLGGEVLGALPDLRYVGILATGSNVVDLDAARGRGIAVTNVPGYSTESVAELVFAHILHFTHGVAAHDAAAKAGAWAAAPDFSAPLRPLRELAGKTLVVVGLGAIGRAVARIGAGFAMRVVAAAVPGSPGAGGAGRTPLMQALAEADVVTLHCPLTEATASLVDARFLAALGPGAILINTGRGGLVDETALGAALAAGRLGGVGLDVLRDEPPPANHPLLAPGAPWAARIAVTPHIGWATVESRARLAREAAANLAAFLAGSSRNRLV